MAPKALKPAALEAPYATGSSPNHHGVTTSAATSPEHHSDHAKMGRTGPFAMDTAQLREEFDAAASGQSLCVAIVEEIALAAASQYIDRFYDVLAVDYAALSIWDEMLLAVQTSLIHQDTGLKHADPTATWRPDSEPQRTPCDVHSRHIIPMKTEMFMNSTSRPMTQGGGSGSNQLSPSFSSMFGGSGMGGGMLRQQRKSKMLDPGSFAAGAGRPSSSGADSSVSGAGGRRGTSVMGQGAASLESTKRARPEATLRRSIASTNGTASDGQQLQSTNNATSVPADGAASSTPSQQQQQQQAAELSADEINFMESVKRKDEEKKRLLAVRAALDAQLQDPKILQKGQQFVVDAATAKVIPVISAEEALGVAGAGRRGQQDQQHARFNVTDAPAPASGQQQQQPPPPSTAPPGLRASRVGHTSTGGTTATAEGRRRDDQFFVPEQQGVAMVINLTPSGGVGVKEGDGASARRSELKLPKNKVSRDEYKRLVAQPVFTDSPSVTNLEPLDTERSKKQPGAPPQSARLGSGKVAPGTGGDGGGNASPQSTAQTARQTATVAATSAAGSKDASAIKAQPPAVRPTAHPPPRSLQARTPRGTRVPPTPGTARARIWNEAADRDLSSAGKRQGGAKIVVNRSALFDDDDAEDSGVSAGVLE